MALARHQEKIFPVGNRERVCVNVRLGYPHMKQRLAGDVRGPRVRGPGDMEIEVLY